MTLVALALALSVGTAAAAQTAPATPPQHAAPAGTAGTTPMAAPAAETQDPAGGYQPSTPALSGTPAPGATVVFRPSPSPSEAFPPPAPLASYPLCKPGQYDNCRQRGG